MEREVDAATGEPTPQAPAHQLPGTPADPGGAPPRRARGVARGSRRGEGPTGRPHRGRRPRNPGHGGGLTRSRGNVPATGLRRGSRGSEARVGRLRTGRGPPPADRGVAAPQGARRPGRGLPLPGLRLALHAGAPRHPVVRRGRDEARQPDPPVPVPSQGRARGRLARGDGTRESAAPGAARFRDPTGRVVPAVPPAHEDVRAPGTADAGLGNWHRQNGIDPWTATSLWLGDPLDLDWALWVLWGQYDTRPLAA